MMHPQMSFEEIESLSDFQILENRSSVLVGQAVYLGDMSNICVRISNTDHTQHKKTRHYYGSEYRFLNGDYAYYMRYDCECCETGHDFLWAVTSDRLFVGRVCSRCGIFDNRSPLAKYKIGDT